MWLLYCRLPHSFSFPHRQWGRRGTSVHGAPSAKPLAGHLRDTPAWQVRTAVSAQGVRLPRRRFAHLRLWGVCVPPLRGLKVTSVPRSHLVAPSHEPAHVLGEKRVSIGVSSTWFGGSLRPINLPFLYFCGTFSVVLPQFPDRYVTDTRFLSKG